MAATTARIISPNLLSSALSLLQHQHLSAITMKFKRAGIPKEPFSGSSDKLILTKVLKGSDPRAWYLEDPSSVPPPCICSSDFVPEAMIEHLMRNR
jgi:hypothetical protein